MTSIAVFIIFVAVQIVAAMTALLFSNLDKLGSGISTANLSPTPVATGLSLLALEALLALGLWLWFFRFEKSVRTKSKERPELLSIFKFHTLKRDLTPHLIHPLSGVLMVVGTLGIAFGVAGVLELLHVSAEENNELFRAMLSNPFCWLLLCLVGPLAEELTFRVGIVRSLYRQNVPSWLAVFISAFAFALVHGNLWQSIPAFVVGLILGWLYLTTGNLRLCLPTHMVNNTLSVLMLAFPALNVTNSLPLTLVFLLVGAALLAWGMYGQKKFTLKQNEVTLK